MGEFFKKNKWAIIISSVLTLLPIAVGLIIWDKLPPTMAMHWGADGNANGFGGRAFVVFGLPLIMLAVHFLCVTVTLLDKKNYGQNKKLISLTLFIAPVISLFASCVIYTVALGKEMTVGYFTVFLGLMFVVMGNYMPKCKQNSTMGVKIKWTLANEENWNATHRIAGKTWVIGGIIIAFMAFLPLAAQIVSFFVALAVLMIIPYAYSATYYKKQEREGRADPNPPGVLNPKNKPVFIGSIIGAVILAVVLIVVCFTGDIEYICTDSGVSVKADYIEDIFVEYSEIDSIEYRESDKPGMRTYGYGSPRLLMGSFKNDEFGHYTRYSYAFGGGCIVIKSDDAVLVIGAENDDETLALFESICGGMEALAK